MAVICRLFVSSALREFGDQRIDGVGHRIAESDYLRMGRRTLSALAIDESFLPPIVAPRRTAGGLRDEFMLRWPMLERATWFQAIGDGAANNIGAGCVSRERVALTVGTSGAMRMLSSRAAPTTLPPELFCYRADRERVVIGGALSDGGGLLRWLQDSLKPV